MDYERIAIVQLVSKTRAGKSTTAKAMQEALLKAGIEHVQVLRFSDPLRALWQHCFGHNDELLKNIPIAQTSGTTDDVVNQLVEFGAMFVLDQNPLYWEALNPMLNQRVLSPRMLMNAAGAAVRRTNPYAFVQYMQERIATDAEKREGFCVYILEDTRFPNELLPFGNLIVLQSGDRGVVQDVDVIWKQVQNGTLDREYAEMDISTPEAAAAIIEVFVQDLLTVIGRN